MGEFDPVELVASAYEGFRRNWDGGSPFAEDVVWHIPVDKEVTLDIPGSGAVMAFLDFAWRVGVTDGFDVSDPEISSKGNTVVAKHTAFAKNGDDEWSDDVTMVCRIQDERIAEVWQFFQNPPAWQSFWASVGATSSTDAPLPPPPPGMQAKDVVQQAYNAVTPLWMPQALRSLLDPNIVWHGIDVNSQPHDYVGVQNVMDYLRWPARVHLVGGRLSVTSIQITPVSASVVTAKHTLTASVATQTTVDHVTLTVTVTNGLISEVDQRFQNPQNWHF